MEALQLQCFSRHIHCSPDHHNGQIAMSFHPRCAKCLPSGFQKQPFGAFQLVKAGDLYKNEERLVRIAGIGPSASLSVVVHHYSGLIHTFQELSYFLLHVIDNCVGCNAPCI